MLIRTEIGPAREDAQRNQEHLPSHEGRRDACVAWRRIRSRFGHAARAVAHFARNDGRGARRAGRRRRASGFPAPSARSARPISSSASFSRRAPTWSAPNSRTRSGSLRDRLPPFPVDQAHAEIEAAFGKPWQRRLRRVRPAARRRLHRPGAQGDGAHEGRRLARGGRENPPAEHREALRARPRKLLFRGEHGGGAFAENAPPSPVAAVDTLAQSVVLEMDLRLEAAAISEMAENIAKAGDTGFRVPKVDWQRTGKRVLTLDWIDGIPHGRPRSHRPRRPRPPRARPQRDPLLPQARHPRRLLPRGHASGQSVRRSARREPYRRGFRHHGPPRPEGAPLPRRNPLRLHRQGLPAHLRNPFRGGLRAGQSERRRLRAIAARHRRADHGPPGRGNLDGAAAHAAFREHRSVPDEDAARASASAKDHGRGGGRGALARPAAEYLDRGGAHRARMADRSARSARAAQGHGGECGRAGGSLEAGAATRRARLEDRGGARPRERSGRRRWALARALGDCDSAVDRHHCADRHRRASCCSADRRPPLSASCYRPKRPPR